MTEKKKLGEIFIDEGIIDQAQLKAALDRQKKWGGMFGSHLVKLGFVSELILLKFLCNQHECPGADLSKTKFKEDVLSLIPKDVAKMNFVLPLEKSNYLGEIFLCVNEIKKIAKKYKLIIIEDACHAPGGYFKDSKGIKQYCGNGVYSDLQIFSFHPVKHIATGEGGMITTNNEDLYKRLLLLRTHGITKDSNVFQNSIDLAYGSQKPIAKSQSPTANSQSSYPGWYYEMQQLGYNYRISDINCALGVSQLKRAKQGVELRNKIAGKYNEAFKNIDAIKTPFVAGNVYHAYHLYIIQVEKRKELYDYLRQHNIFTQVHYIPVHLQPYYKQLGWKKGDFPVAEAYYEKALSLPMFPTLMHTEQNFVINKILSFYENRN